MQYLDASMFGTYYIDCILIGITENGMYKIQYYDDFAEETVTKIVEKSRIKEEHIMSSVKIDPSWKTKAETIHHVKSWSHFYDAIKSGLKTHELRDNDRNYKIGDLMCLQRYDNINGRYTGDECMVEITYITNRERPCAFSCSVLDPNYCILSIRRVD